MIYEITSLPNNTEHADNHTCHHIHHMQLQQTGAWRIILQLLISGVRVYMGVYGSSAALEQETIAGALWEGISMPGDLY